MKGTRTVRIGMVTIALAALAIFPGAGSAIAQVDTTVVMAGAQMVPAVAVLENGQKITWQNLDPLKHNVAPNPQLGPTVGGSFPVVSPLLEQLQTWSCSPAGSYKWRCDKDKEGKVRTISLPAGQYAYLCQPHSTWQHGILIVV